MLLLVYSYFYYQWMTIVEVKWGGHCFPKDAQKIGENLKSL